MFTDDLTRELLDRIDARLRDSERLRSHEDQRRSRVPFWPDRRRVERDIDDRRHHRDTDSR